MRNVIQSFLIALAVSACSGRNPNPGERTVDLAWTSGNFDRAFAYAKPAADRGEPWAQLRVGIFYENGWGIEREPKQAITWYEKAIAQTGSGAWADGQIVGAIGKAGFFNQNSDAIIAEFNLAQLLYKADGVARDLPIAYVHAVNAFEGSKGAAVFFCCEFDGGRYVNSVQFSELKEKIEIAMTPADKEHAMALLQAAHNQPIQPAP